MSLNSFEKLIEDFGVVSTLTQSVSGSFNIDTGILSTTNPTYTVTAYLYENDDTVKNDSERQFSDTRALLHPKQTDGTAVPSIQTDDSLTVDSKTYSIKKCSPIRRGSNILYYVLTLRG